MSVEFWILNEKKCNSPASAENSRKRFHHEGREEHEEDQTLINTDPALCEVQGKFFDRIFRIDGRGNGRL